MPSFSRWNFWEQDAKPENTHWLHGFSIAIVSAGNCGVLVKRRRKRKLVSRLHRARRGEVPGTPWAPVSPQSPFIEETLTYWQPRSPRVLTREDAREIIQNVVGFLAILDEWDRAERDMDSSVSSAPEAAVKPPTEHVSNCE